jgi:hypothetical protein
MPGQECFSVDDDVAARLSDLAPDGEEVDLAQLAAARAIVAHRLAQAYEEILGEVAREAAPPEAVLRHAGFGPVPLETSSDPVADGQETPANNAVPPVEAVGPLRLRGGASATDRAKAAVSRALSVGGSGSRAERSHAPSDGDIIENWAELSDLGKPVRSAALRRVDAAVVALRAQPGDPARLHGVLDAIDSWRSNKTRGSHRDAVVSELEVRVRRDLGEPMPVAPYPGQDRRTASTQQMVASSRDLALAGALLSEDHEAHVERLRSELRRVREGLDSTSHAAGGSALSPRVTPSLEQQASRIQEDLKILAMMRARLGSGRLRLREPQMAALVTAERRGRQVHQRELEAARQLLRTRAWAEPYAALDVNDLLQRVHAHLKSGMRLVTNLQVERVEAVVADPSARLRNFWEVMPQREEEAEPTAYFIRRGNTEDALGYSATVRGWNRQYPQPGSQEASDLPKYGALVSRHQPNGLLTYGPVVLVWAREVRDRSTFTPQDSAAILGDSNLTHVTGPDHLYPLLVRGSDDIVRLAFAEATGFAHDPQVLQMVRQGRYSGPNFLRYFEAQIHGELTLADAEQVLIGYDPADATAHSTMAALRDRILRYARDHSLTLPVELRPFGDDNPIAFLPPTAPSPLPSGEHDVVAYPVSVGSTADAVPYVASERRMLVAPQPGQMERSGETQEMVPSARDLMITRALLSGNPARYEQEIRAYQQTRRESLAGSGARGPAEQLAEVLSQQARDLSEDQQVLEQMDRRLAGARDRLGEPEVAALVLVERHGRQIAGRELQTARDMLSTRPWGGPYLQRWNVDELLRVVHEHLRSGMRLVSNMRPIGIEAVLAEPGGTFRNYWETSDRMDGFEEVRAYVEHALGYAATTGPMVLDDSGEWAPRYPEQDSREAHALPKYAALHSRMLPEGEQRYGSVVLVWRPEVRARTTYTPRDSIQAEGWEWVTGPDHLYPLLTRSVDVTARLAFAEATGFSADSAALEAVRAPLAGRDRLKYIEAQIHGDLSLADVERVLLWHAPASAQGSRSEGSDLPTYEAMAALRDRILTYARVHSFTLAVELRPAGNRDPIARPTVRPGHGRRGNDGVVASAGPVVRVEMMHADPASASLDQQALQSRLDQLEPGSGEYARVKQLLDSWNPYSEGDAGGAVSGGTSDGTGSGEEDWNSQGDIPSTLRQPDTVGSAPGVLDATNVTSVALGFAELEERITHALASFDAPSGKSGKSGESGLSECLTRLESVRGALFPRGVYPSGTVDDMVVGSDTSARPEDRLAPGSDWRRVADWQGVADALAQKEPGSVAFVLARRLGIGPDVTGHAWAAYRLPPNDTTGEDTGARTAANRDVAWIEVLNGAGGRVSFALPARVPRGVEAKAVIVDPSGRTDQTALPFLASSDIPGAALNHPAASHTYRGFGIEVEDSRMLVWPDGSEPLAGTPLATHTSGMKIVTDYRLMYRGPDGAHYLSPQPGQDLKDSMVVTVAEVISPPLQLFNTDAGRMSILEGLGRVDMFFESIAEADKAPRPQTGQLLYGTPLKNLLQSDPNWTFTEQGLTAGVVPKPHGWGIYPQFTVSIPIRDVGYLLDFLFQNLQRSGWMFNLVDIGRDFSLQVARLYAEKEFSIRSDKWSWPFLSTLPGVDEIRGYAWLAFIDVGAGVMYEVFKVEHLSKNSTPTALRNTWDLIHGTLHPSIRGFLADDEQWMTDMFRAALGRLGQFPVEYSGNILARRFKSGITFGDWVTAAITGYRRVRERNGGTTQVPLRLKETFAMKEYPLDTYGRGTRDPAILIELREFFAGIHSGVHSVRGPVNYLVNSLQRGNARGELLRKFAVSTQDLELLESNPLFRFVNDALKSSEPLTESSTVRGVPVQRPLLRDMSLELHSLLELILQRNDNISAHLELALQALASAINKEKRNLSAGSRKLSEFEEASTRVMVASYRVGAVRVLREYQTFFIPSLSEFNEAEKALRRPPNLNEFTRLLWARHELNRDGQDYTSGEILDALAIIPGPKLFEGKAPEAGSRTTPSTYQELKAALNNRRMTSQGGTDPGADPRAGGTHQATTSQRRRGSSRAESRSYRPYASATAVDGPVRSGAGFDTSGPEWTRARRLAQPVERTHTWAHPLALPEDGNELPVHATLRVRLEEARDGEPTNPESRSDVHSAFAVRRFMHEGQAVTDLTVRVAIRPSPDVTPDEVTAARAAALAGAEHLNAEGVVPRLTSGDRLHVTVLFTDSDTPLALHDQGGPHLTVDLVNDDSGMTQTRWQTNAGPLRYAHEIGHQIGLRDNHGILGTLMGEFGHELPREWEAAGLTQDGIRQRDIELLHHLIGDNLPLHDHSTPAVGPLPAEEVLSAANLGPETAPDETVGRWAEGTADDSSAGTESAAVAPDQVLHLPDGAVRDGLAPPLRLRGGASARDRVRAVMSRALSVGGSGSRAGGSRDGDIIENWVERSDLGKPVRSAALRRVDGAVQALRAQPGDPARLHGVLNAIDSWRSRKTRGSHRDAVVSELEARIRRELSELSAPARQREAGGAAGPAGGAAGRSAIPGSDEVGALIAHLRAIAGPVEAAGPVRAGLGPDLFGSRRTPAPPDFLHGVRLTDIATDQLVPFFEAVSMTNETRPAPGVLSPQSLPHWPETVVTADFRDEELAWAGTALPDDDPFRLMPATVSVPRLVGAIWLGGPPDPGDETFWEALGGVAQALDDDARMVLLTDLTRDEVRSAREMLVQDEDEREVGGDGGRGAQGRESVRRPRRLVAVGKMLDWALDNRVLLVNVDEISAAAGFMLDDAYRAELARRTTSGYARAADVLRFAFAERVGILLYTDHDNAVQPEFAGAWDGAFLGGLEDLFVRRGWAASGPLFAMNNSAFMAGRGHPFPRWVLNGMEQRYGLTQRELYLNQPAGYSIGYDSVPVSPHMDMRRVFRWALGRHERLRRTSVMLRTGPYNLWQLSNVPGPRITQLVTGRASTWLKGHPLGRQRTYRRDEVPMVVRDVVASLVRDLYNREGDLHLTLVAPVIAGLPDPDAGWRAAVGFILSRPDLRDLIRTVTDRLFWSSDGRRAELASVPLPADVRAALGVPDVPTSQITEGTWILGELARPANITVPGQPGQTLTPVFKADVADSMRTGLSRSLTDQRMSPRSRAKLKALGQRWGSLSREGADSSNERAQLPVGQDAVPDSEAIDAASGAWNSAVGDYLAVVADALAETRHLLAGGPVAGTSSEPDPWRSAESRIDDAGVRFDAAEDGLLELTRRAGAFAGPPADGRDEQAYPEGHPDELVPDEGLLRRATGLLGVTPTVIDGDAVAQQQRRESVIRVAQLLRDGRDQEAADLAAAVAAEQGFLSEALPGGVQAGSGLSVAGVNYTRELDWSDDRAAELADMVAELRRDIRSESEDGQERRHTLPLSDAELARLDASWEGVERKLRKMIVAPRGQRSRENPLIPGAPVGRHPDFGAKTETAEHLNATNLARFLLGWTEAKPNRRREKELARQIETSPAVSLALDSVLLRMGQGLTNLIANERNKSGTAARRKAILSELATGRLADGRPATRYLSHFDPASPRFQTSGMPEELAVSVWDNSRGLRAMLKNPYDYSFREKVMGIHDFVEYFTTVDGSSGRPLAMNPSRAQYAFTLEVDEHGRRVRGPDDLEAERPVGWVRDKAGEWSRTRHALDESSPWVTLARERNIPIWDGPSYTAARLMKYVDIFHGGALEKAAVAWAMAAFWRLHYDHRETPAHTFHEVLDVAQNFGVPYSLNEPYAGIEDLTLTSLEADFTRTLTALETAASEALADPAEAQALLSEARQVTGRLRALVANPGEDPAASVTTLQEAVRLIESMRKITPASAIAEVLRFGADGIGRRVNLTDLATQSQLDAIARSGGLANLDEVETLAARIAAAFTVPADGPDGPATDVALTLTFPAGRTPDSITSSAQLVKAVATKLKHPVFMQLEEIGAEFKICW